MTKVLVVANETIGGRKLLDAVLARHKQATDTQFFLVVPQSRPRHGNIVFDDAVRDAAQVRVDLAVQVMSRAGVHVTGDVGDTDPFNATLDAVAEWQPDEIIVSTHPAPASGWLRRDLIERLEGTTGLPVEHVVTDLAKEGLPFEVTLVLANRTAGTPALLERLQARAEEGEHLFIVVVPQDGVGGLAARAARARLAGMLDTLRSAELLGAGFIADPDPYVAALNALETFTVTDVVISTFAATRSGWLRQDLISRVRHHTHVPVEHVVVTFEEAAATAADAA